MNAAPRLRVNGCNAAIARPHQVKNRRSCRVTARRFSNPPEILKLPERDELPVGPPPSAAPLDLGKRPDQFPIVPPSCRRHPRSNLAVVIGQ